MENFKNKIIRYCDNGVNSFMIFSVTIGILTFILYPIISVIFYSFFINGIFSFRAYENIFSNNIGLLKNSVLISTTSALIATTIAFCIAFVELFLTEVKQKILYIFLMLTMISPPFVSSLAFISLFGRRGIITYRLLGLDFNPYGWHGVLILQIIGEISFAAIMLITFFKTIDNKLIKASRNLGASSLETLKRVFIPMVMPGLIATFFLLFTKSLADFGTPIIMGGNFSTLATESYLMVIGKGDFSKGAAMSILLIIPSLFAFYLYKINMKRLEYFSHGARETISRESILEPPKSILIISKIVVIIFIGIMIIKYIAIFLFGFANYTNKGLIFTREYFYLFIYGKKDALIRSIIYSFIAGIIGSVIGLLMSYYTDRLKLKGFKTLEFITSLPYIIPGTFFGLGYILAFNKEPIYLVGSSAIVLLNCIFRPISNSQKICSSLFLSINPQIEKVARDLGTPKIMIIKDIIFPILKPAYISSFITIFTASMTTAGTLIFLVSPGSNVATIEMFNTIRDGDYGVASVIATFIILITVTVNIVAFILTNKMKGGFECS